MDQYAKTNTSQLTVRNYNMQISVVLRKNKIAPEIVAARLTDERHVLFDNCTQLSFGVTPVETDRAGFDFIRKVESTPGVLQHRILKDPAFVEDEDEMFHYNTIRWVDRVTGQRNELRFDTFAFILSDDGKKVNSKVKG